jgi:hypothetical protein
MFFLLRLAFWLSIVVVLLPAPPAKDVDPNRPQVSALEALSAATAAVQDARGFCERKPEACEVGSQALHSFGVKAQYGAKMLYDFLTDRLAGAPNANRPVQPGRDTLTPTDLTPAWNAPEKPVPVPPRRPA